MSIMTWKWISMQSAYSLSQELDRGQGIGRWIARAQDGWTATIKKSPPRKLSMLWSCSVSLTWMLEYGEFLFHLDYERFILLNINIHFNTHLLDYILWKTICMFMQNMLIEIYWNLKFLDQDIWFRLSPHKVLKHYQNRL